MANQQVYLPKISLKKKKKTERGKREKNPAIRRVDWGENIKWMFLHKKTQADNISAL